MLVLSRTISTAKNSVPRSLTQAFPCVYARSIQSSVDAPAPKSKRTRKNATELPTNYVLADGTIAPPLAPFYSSSTESHDPPPKRKRSVRSHPEDESNMESATVRVTRKRKTKTSEKVEDVTDLHDTLPKQSSRRKAKSADDAETVPKRTSRKRVQVLSENDENQPLDQGKGLLSREIQANLAKFPHCLLLTRVGNFYESYFEQAEEIASLLKIKCTSRKWSGSRIPMCGFPITHLDKHLKILVSVNQRFVAMCEEFPATDSFGKKEFERRVVRVITPGTLVDESFLNPYENNFLLSISAAHELASSNVIGLAWIDVSTGEFFSRSSDIDNLADQLARIGPREVVLDSSFEACTSHPIRMALAEEGSFTTFIQRSNSGTPEESETPTTLLDPPKAIVQDRLPVDDVQECNQEEKPSGTPSLSSYTPEETSAIDLLTTYMHRSLMEHMPVISMPNREGLGSRMQIDSHTIKALEIRERMHEGSVKGSLLSVVRRTVTTGGNRLLARWICSPSTSIAEINARQSLVALFCSRPHFRSDITALLAEAEDASRIVQRFLMGRGEANDLVAIQNTIRTWLTIQARVYEERKMEEHNSELFRLEVWTSLDLLMSRLENLTPLLHRLSSAVDTEASTEETVDEDSSEDPTAMLPVAYAPLRLDGRLGTSRKFSIKPQYSKELDSLHAELTRAIKEREEMEQDLQRRFAAPTLTLRASPAQGFHVHMSKKRRQKSIEDSSELVLLAESGSTKSYFYQEWAQLASRIMETTTKLFAAEKQAFEELRREVKAYAPSLRRNARILEEMDVTLGFAELACELNFVRPQLVETPDCAIDNGRHPTVELGLLTSGRVFTPNSLHLDSQKGVQQVITGPNMGGKSTFLRQTALIAILAQAGSFVPADSARLGIVDKIFSRVGAKDDLYHDRSTFMVEMLETADILRRATDRSLVIMDEVGRGTTVQDGLAIAFATIHHLTTVNKCRALFATHFHELSYLLGRSSGQESAHVYPNVGYQCFDVHETKDGHFAYSYRIREGINFDSHGLKVAKLAGMPDIAMKVAESALGTLSRQGCLDPHQLAQVGAELSLSK